MMRIKTTEDDFPKIQMKISGKIISGRDIYGFFVSEEEFKKLSPKVCSDGYLGPLNRKVDRINLMGSKVIDPDPEYDKAMDRHEFIAQSEFNTIKKLNEYGLPVRKINFIRRLIGYNN